MNAHGPAGNRVSHGSTGSASAATGPVDRKALSTFPVRYYARGNELTVLELHAARVAHGRFVAEPDLGHTEL